MKLELLLINYIPFVLGFPKSVDATIVICEYDILFNHLSKHDLL